MSITAKRLFYGAYRAARLVNLEQTILGPDQEEEARETYNRMVDAMSADGLTISHVSRETFAVASGSGDYTIGPGGDWDTTWPDRIERAGIIVSSGSGYPAERKLNQLTIDQWQAWTFKTQPNNWPWSYFYERAFPLGIVHLLYVPNNATSVILYLEHPLSAIAVAADYATVTLEFQPGYQEMLETNLAVQLAESNPRAQISQSVIQRAKSSMMLLKAVNARPLSRTSDFARGGTRPSVYLGNRY
jgi:hypothetical protein